MGHDLGHDYLPLLHLHAYMLCIYMEYDPLQVRTALPPACTHACYCLLLPTCCCLPAYLSGV